MNNSLLMLNHEEQKQIKLQENKNIIALQEIQKEAKLIKNSNYAVKDKEIIKDQECNDEICIDKKISKFS